ncbi:MAG: LysM peptidoglycan-binding domain-containing protein, partial [Krumholzibacteria bacterium]|nr:LysM peptidoglycan-binding domain-containing protein [Candidatus Krumholzibacteria bacterium]
MQKATTFALILLLAGGAAWAGQADPDTIDYTVQDGDSLVKICGLHRSRTNHYSLTDMLTDIRRTNGLQSNFLRVGQRLRIPVLAAAGGARVDETVAGGAEVRGIYLTGPACASSSVFERVDAFIAAGGNAVVFDAKDIDGAVSYRSAHPLASPGAGRSAPMIPSLADMMERFRGRGLYVIARLALFLDGELGRLHPELALQDPAGAAWSERDCAWIDPAHPRVRDYLLSLAVELARAGVDEIQFDYVRFPTNGWRGDWSGDLAGTAARRRAVIAGFLAAARDSLDGHGVRISTDLFGIMAWDRVEDLALTGQHVPTIAALVDVVCPMIYPSHFAPGFEGRRRPGDDPAYFVGEGTRRFLRLVDGQAEVRPWLQAFPYMVSEYDGRYVATQMAAAMAAGATGWCLWSPSASYGVALEVLPAVLDGTDPTAAAVLLAAAGSAP